MKTAGKVKSDLYTSLKELGLTDSEANLYTTSLSLGPATIVSLADHLNIPRPNVYKVIAGLETYGLAKFSERKKFARTFVVEPPTVVLQKLREKRTTVAHLDQSLVALMPDLLAQYHQGEAPTKVKIYQGQDQWMDLFFQILDETTDPISFFGSADAFIEMISWETEQEWIKERVKRGIPINVLLVPGKDAQTLKETDESQMRTTRLFHGKTPFVTGFMLYANKVVIWQPRAPLAILIEDEYIVQMLKSIFETLWGISEGKVR